MEDEVLKSGKRVLITGATGFIGSNLAKFLEAKGFFLKLLCRPTSDFSNFLNDSVEICLGNILDVQSLERAIEGCDFVFHLAAYAKNWAKDPGSFFEVNVKGTRNVLEVSRKAGVKKVIHTSTCMTFGSSKTMPVDESWRREEDFFTEYERTKSRAEEVADIFFKEGLPVVIVSPTRLFGPGLLSEANSVTRMIKLYLQKKWRLILSDGTSVGNYAYIKDVVEGMWLALLRGKPGEKYILGGENLSYNRFFEVLGAISGKKYRMFHIPLWMAFTFSRLQLFLAKKLSIYPLLTPGWVKVFARNWAFSSEKAKKELGYRITPFQDALTHTVAWLQKEVLGERGRK